MNAVDTTILPILERELRDAINDLEDCENALTEGRVINQEAHNRRYWTLYDRVTELERRIEPLRNASGAA